MRIDILNEIDGVQFADAIRGKQFFISGKLSIPFIGKEDFIKNKKATGRKKDMEDAKKVQPKLIKKKDRNEKKKFR